MKRFLTAVVFALLPLYVLAQSANMMTMARGELQKRGLQEAEVRVRLLENGIDVDNIAPTEYAAYQERVMSILNQMQQEKAAEAAARNRTDSTRVAGATTTTATVGADDIPQTSMGEAAAEAALARALDESQAMPEDNEAIYGHSLFNGTSLDVFRTTDGAQAPESYILGEGDEVHISIFGSSQTEIHQRISSDGSIQPVGVNKIFLKGMTLAQGRKAIISKLAQHYSFRQDQIAVTITTARTVTANIYGEVGIQGGFTLSALNTVFNALAAAGGPTPLGSVRNIQLSRGGKTQRMDLYAYMANPTSSSYYDLQNGDVLFVPVAQKVVRIEGAIGRPMRYEMLDDEDLKDLIGYAGGLAVNVYPEFVQIERYENGERSYLDYNLGEVMSGSKKVRLVRGDVVRVRATNEPLEKFVAISGAVYYDGPYDLSKNNTLSALIESAKPRYTAKTDYVFIERTRPDETVEVLTVPFPGINGNPDFPLEARDRVRIVEQDDYRDIATISVNGQVREPFSRPFGRNDRMTVEQAIGLAGGVLPSVYPVAYIVRTDVTNPSKRSYLAINLDNEGGKLLQPGDSLNVYDNSTYTNIGEVRISGAVKSPLATTFDSSLSLHDLISMAGGFTEGAAYNRVEVFRLIASDTEESKHELLTLTVDKNYNPVNGFQLAPYDHVVVRMTPDFTTGRTVEVNGRVKYPGVYVLDDAGTQLSEILAKAGGLLSDANPYCTIFRIYNDRGSIGMNLDDVKRNKGNMAEDPYLMEGDVINIVRMENTVSIRETGTRMAQYVMTGQSATQKSVVYQGARPANWYIKHYAGGFQKTADRNSVTVTLPNNQTEATRHFLWWRIYPKVQPGSVIALRQDPDKVKKQTEPKEKADFEGIIAKSLSGITSVASIVILARNLAK